MSRRTLVAARLNRWWKVLTSDRNLARRLRRAAPLILTFVILTFLLERAGWLSSVETYALDVFVLLREPLESPNVVIVGITDADYSEEFGGRSPLDASKLKALIDAIAKGHPAVIGIDLDTSDESFRQLRLDGMAPVIVWARDAERVPTKEEVLPHFLPFFNSSPETFTINKLPGREGQEVLSGVALVPADSDATIRRFRRQFLTTAGTVTDSFSWAVVKAYLTTKGGTAGQSGDSEDDWVMNYSTDPNSFKPFSAGQVLTNYSTKAGWAGDFGPVRDKIVLLGALYRTSRDQHETPTGTRYGVELLAHAVESDLQGRTLKPPSKYLIWTGELLAGFALVLVHSIFKKRPRSFRYSIVAVPLLAALASFVVFSSYALWALFLPVLLAVLIQQLHDDVEDYRTRAIEGLYQEGQSLGQYLKKILASVRGTGGRTRPVAKSEAVAESEIREQGPRRSADKPPAKLPTNRSAGRHKSKSRKKNKGKSND